MSYLIDTCALSELLTLGEIRKGVESLSDIRRRDKIMNWLKHELPVWFEDRILPIDAGVADEWGHLLAKAGRSIPAIDSLIAATALHHRLTIVTRNVTDFNYVDLNVFNPWQP